MIQLRKKPNIELYSLLMVIILLIFVIFALCMMSKITEATQNMEATLLCDGKIYYQKTKSKIAEIQKCYYLIDKEKPVETTSAIETTEGSLEIIENMGITEDECDLPTISTNVKLFTDYRVYNLWYTPHYRLQQSAWTDNQGLRRYNKDYIVALGSYYSTNIGDRFEITLDTGKIFTVILGDGKVDADCDIKNMYTPCVDYEGNTVANLLEFIIDENVLDSEVYNYGSLDCLDEFKGNIVKMIYLGRDESQDWDTYENN